MIVLTSEQAKACDRKGPYFCAQCGEKVSLPCLFILGGKPGLQKWAHIVCKGERRETNHSTADLKLDVSTVNKILNKAPGMVFNEATKRRVFKMAEELGYDFERGTKGWSLATLRTMFPQTVEDIILAEARGISVEMVQSIKSRLYRDSA
jgi:hypothetical protein